MTTRLKYDIANEDIYNMDEKGVMKGIGDSAKVIISRKDKEAFTNQPGNREWVSIIEYIGINSYSLLLYIIFQGQRIQHSWIDEKIDDKFVIQVSPNGWTDQEIALSWLQHFDHYTKLQTHGKYRLLIVNGHTNHVSYKFIKYCTDHDIVLLYLPPHATHVLQPLDIGIFSSLAKAYKQIISRRAIFGTRTVDNRQFLLYYQDVRKGIPFNIEGAWKGIGLLPYDPDKILDKYPQPTIPPSERPLTAERPSTATFTNSDGRRVDIVAQPGDNLARRINEIVEQLIDVCLALYKDDVVFIQQTCLTSLATQTTLQVINKGLKEQQEEARRKQTFRKAFLGARELTLADAKRLQKEQEEEAVQKLTDKQRRAALKGKVTFVKRVWKEIQMDVDIFE